MAGGTQHPSVLSPYGWTQEVKAVPPGDALCERWVTSTTLQPMSVKFKGACPGCGPVTRLICSSIQQARSYRAGRGDTVGTRQSGALRTQWEHWQKLSKKMNFFTTRNESLATMWGAFRKLTASQQWALRHFHLPCCQTFLRSPWKGQDVVGGLSKPHAQHCHYLSHLVVPWRTPRQGLSSSDLPFSLEAFVKNNQQFIRYWGNKLTKKIFFCFFKQKTGK